MEHITIRQYETHQEYLNHQASKLSSGLSWLNDYEKMYSALLFEILHHLQGTISSFFQPRVLCLGARRGTEVRVFKSLGFECIGIDINPGPDNPLVIKGDFHNLDPSIPQQDVVYTNCLDHIIDPDKFLNEVKRILNPGGYFVILYASVEAVKNDKFASFGWDSFDNVLELIQRYGFEAVKQIPIEQNNFFEAVQILRRTET